MALGSIALIYAQSENDMIQNESAGPTENHMWNNQRDEQDVRLITQWPKKWLFATRRMGKRNIPLFLLGKWV